MSNATCISPNDKKVLNDFLLDTSLLHRLDKWIGTLNIFDALGVSRWEIKHSNFLAWLMAPGENHGMRNQFLDGLVKRLVTNNDSLSDDALDLMLLNTTTCDVQREWKDIDILISSSQASFVIAIENKVGSKESKGQLEKYHRIVEQDFKEYKHKIYVYLTPDGDDASDPALWNNLSYQDIAEVLEEIVSRANLDADVNILIQHYISNIRRNIVNDNELAGICNEIYKKHKDAFELVMKYKTIGKSGLYNVIESVIDEFVDNGTVIKDEKRPYMFRTNKMNSLLPPLDSPISSWGNNHLYQYWFNCFEDDDNSYFYLIFELGGINVPEAQDMVMKQLIDEQKPHSSRDTFKYYRIYKTAKVEIEKDVDDYEEKVKEKARKAIEELLKMEDELFRKVMNSDVMKDY